MILCFFSSFLPFFAFVIFMWRRRRSPESLHQLCVYDDVLQSPKALCLIQIIFITWHHESDKLSMSCRKCKGICSVHATAGTGRRTTRLPLVQNDLVMSCLMEGKVLHDVPSRLSDGVIHTVSQNYSIIQNEHIYGYNILIKQLCAGQCYNISTVWGIFIFMT